MRLRNWVVLAVLATLAGLGMLETDSTVIEAVGASLVGVVLVAGIWLTVARLGPQSQPDREREELAREEFERTGSWPGE
jgi:hypothetical protein